VEGDVALACLVVKGGEAAGGRGPDRAPAGGRPRAGGRARQPRIARVQPLLCVAKGDQVPYALALIFGRSGPERRGRAPSFPLVSLTDPVGRRRSRPASLRRQRGDAVITPS
jgi:hypothetical protein